MNQLLIIIIIFSYILSLWFGAFAPEAKKLSNLKTELSDQENVLFMRKEYAERLRRASNKIAKQRENIDKMEIALPKDAELSYTLEFIQDTISRTGLIFKKISGISVSNVKNDEGKRIEETRVGLEVKSSYASFLNFLEEVEKSARLIEVDSISFVYPEELEGGETYSPLFDFSVTLKTRSTFFKKKKKNEQL